MAKTWYNQLSLSALKLMQANKAVCGFHLGYIPDEELISRTMLKLLELYEQGMIKPRIDSRYHFEEVGSLKCLLNVKHFHCLPIKKNTTPHHFCWILVMCHRSYAMNIVFSKCYVWRDPDTDNLPSFRAYPQSIQLLLQRVTSSAPYLWHKTSSTTSPLHGSLLQGCCQATVSQGYLLLTLTTLLRDFLKPHWKRRSICSLLKGRKQTKAEAGNGRKCVWLMTEKHFLD